MFRYVRHKKIKARRDKERADDLIRLGRVDLQRRCLDAWGNVRPNLGQNGQQISNESQQPNEQQPKEKEKTVGDQLLDSVMSGKLVHMLNNLQIKTKGLAKRFEPTLTPEQRLQAERQAQLADESVNPLYSVRQKLRRDADTEPEDTDSLSPQNTDATCSDADESSEFDADDCP